MIKFNELRITPDNKTLIIDVCIEDTELYSSAMIDKVYIFDQDTLDPGNISGDKAIWKQIESECTSLTLKLTEDELGKPLDSNIFFIYVEADVDATIDCAYDQNKVIGTAISMKQFYDKTIEYIKTVGSCNISVDFINYMLMLKSLELSINCADYFNVIRVWKMLKGITPKSVIGGCCCGRT